MAYRRDRNKGPGSSRWRLQHRSILLKWLPAEIVNDHRRFTYVLLHGDDLHNPWTPDDLSLEELKEFLKFLEVEREKTGGLDLFAEITRGISRKMPK